jgi:polysaccharide deacetylase 2 family uncharacterized protein YibQ
MGYFWAGAEVIVAGLMSSVLQCRKFMLATISSAAMALAVISIHISGLHAATAHGAMPGSPSPSACLFKNTTGQPESALLNALNAKLVEIETRSSDITRSFSKQSSGLDAGDSILYISARVPRGRPLEWMAWSFTQATLGTCYRVSDCFFDEKKQSCVFVFSSNEKKAPRIQFTVSRCDRYMSATGEIAFIGEIEEDTTYQTIVSFLSLPDPLAIAVISCKKQSALIAQLADHYRKEVIIRIPLEPVSKIPSDFTSPVIMVHYSKDAVHPLFSQAIKSVPNFSGFTNFWGSRALEDSRIMSILFNEIKKTRGYFLETKTAKNSVARSLAQTAGVPFGDIAVSISGKARQGDVDKQLRGIAATAQNSGAASVFLPLNAATVSALKTLSPWFKQNGITLVFPSKIVQ